MATLGTAYIEVKADTSPFARDLEAKLKEILKVVQKEADVAGGSYGKRLGSSAKKEVEKAGREIGSDLGKTVENELVKSGNKLENFFSDIGQNVQSLFSKIGTKVTSLFADLDPATLMMYAAWATIIPAIVGLLITLGTVVYNLIGLLGLVPGLLGSILFTLGPLFVVFQGFSKFLGDVFTGNVRAMNEDLAKMPPHMRSAAKEIQGMIPFFQKLKDLTSEAFFRPLVGVFTQLQTALGPTIIGGFVQVASSFSQNFVTPLLKLMATPQFASFLRDMFAGAAQLAQIMGGPTIELLKAIGMMAQAAQPIILALGQAFGGALTSLAQFIEKSVKDGSFIKWIQTGVDTGRQLWGIIKALFAVLGDLFSSTKGDAADLLDKIKMALEQLDTFFKSPQGKDAIKGMIDLAKIFGYALYGASAIALNLLGVLGKAVDYIKWVLEHLGIISKQAPAKITKSLQPLYPTLGRANQAAPHAVGGVFDTPHVGLVAEAGPEAIIPLSDRSRAAQVMRQAGLDTMGGGGQTVVYVYIGNEPIDSRAMKVVSGYTAALGRAIAYGPRGEV